MYLLFDIGGTKTRMASSTDGTKVDETITIETPKDFEKGMALICENLKKLARGKKPKAIAGGIAGPVNQDKKSLSASPNLPDWVGKPIVDEIANSFSVPVFLENDAALAALGEACVGAGYGFSIVAYLTVSTGVGGARIVNGKLDEKTIGFEPGHQIIDADKTMAPKAKSKMFEDYISGTSVFEATGKKPKEVADPAFWEDMARLLAYGLNNTAVYWSPDVIVLGGSMITGDPAIPLDKTEEFLHEMLTIYKEYPKLKMAELGDLGGIHGALEYIKQQKV